MKAWFVYMLRCADDTLYTGIATDVERRVKEHNEDNKKASKYVRVRRPALLVYQKACKDKSEASKEEARIKQLSRKEKATLFR